MVDYNGGRDLKKENFLRYIVKALDGTYRILIGGSAATFKTVDGLNASQSTPGYLRPNLNPFNMKW